MRRLTGQYLDTTGIMGLHYSRECPRWKNAWAYVFNEVYIENIYQKIFSVEKGDYVVDLGCSMGVFYFKVKHKNVDYVGIEAAQKNLDKFNSLLTDDDNVTLMNRMVNEKKTGIIGIEENAFDDDKETEAEAISFKEILKLRDKKIDFLKFDIEGEEVGILNNNKSYELFVNNVFKFSGEFHLIQCYDTDGRRVYPLSYSNPDAIEVLEKLRNDKRVDLRISSTGGVDITKRFWEDVKDGRLLAGTGVVSYEQVQSGFYNSCTEIIISGKIL